jgi:hypothetical protein
MKYKSIFAVILIALFSLWGGVLKAYDFSYTYQGKTLYYTKTSSNTVSVTYYCFHGSSDIDYVSGDVTIPSQVTSIDGYTYSVTSVNSYAFSNCSLTSVKIPTSVTSIESSAFADCNSLTNIEIPTTVTSIKENTFMNCSSLRSITIHSSINSIEHNAFYNCGSLDTIIINSDSVCKKFWGGSYDDTITMPTVLILGGSVVSINEDAFRDCTSLTNVVIDSSVTSICNYAFLNCSNLTSVTIPNSVTFIGQSAFYNCSSLTSITIPNSVTSIGQSVFENCSSLTSVTIPNSVTSIGQSAFYNCSNLTSITIPNSVTSIGRSAFYNCSSLTSITIPNSVTSIGNWTFGNCSSLINITIPNSITSIGNWFENCSSLTSITIPNSVTSISSYTFFNCISLTSVNIPPLVTSIGSKTFYHCINLTNIDMDTLSSLTYIDGNAFEECISLTSLEIPSTLTSIENDAFKGCVSLDTIICKSTTPPLISNVSAFEDLPTDAILLVPCTAVNTYKSKGSWLRFKNYTYSYETSSQEISATICANETYNFNGKILTTSGIYTDTLQNTNGCDSVITLTLNTYPSFENPVIEQVIYEGDSVDFMGNTLTKAGTYKDTLQTINGCDSIFTMKIFTLPKDTITIVQHDTVTLYDTITQIIYDTIIRPCARIYTYIYATINEGEKYSDYGFTKTEAGTYTNIFKTEDGCDSTVVLYLTVLSGLDNAESSQILLYPNPTNEKVYLSLTNIPNAEITIRDIMGNVVKKEKVLANETEVVLDVKDLASGTYTIMLSNDKTRVTKKLIKR